MNHPPNVDDMIRILLSGYRVSNNCASLSQWHIQRVCSIARSVFLANSMCLNIVAPVSIVGDIHGQFKDLLRIFKNKGAPPQQRYLFLGDYVDRGKNSVETITLLLCFKIKYPNDIFLLRGNHESASLNKTYGFFDECKRRFSTKLWKCFVDCYNCMPVAAIIENRIFCCHGGLSPELIDIDDINNIERPTEIPDSGILCDLLWSDPDRICGWGKSTRGVSFIFGSDVVDHFLARNDFDLICRGHQVVEDGYEFFAKRQLVTIFSAPNYCGIFDNAGAVMGIDANLRITFEIYKGKKVTVSTHVKTISATASSTVGTHSTKSHISK